MSDEIRKIALEFFKDKFSSIYNKQKKLIVKIEALEKKLIEPISDNQTVKIYVYSDINPDDIKEQIAELGDKLQKCGVKWDFGLDEHGGFITELKEEMKIFKGAVINYNHDYDRIRKVREVLRDHITSHSNLSKEMKGDVDREVLLNLWDGEMKIQLEKLDSKTEKKGCFNCEYLLIYNCKNRDAESYREFMYTTFRTGICDNYKASGGEQSVEGVSDGEKDSPQQSDSKLPELDGTDNSMIYHPDQSTVKTEPEKDYIAEIPTHAPMYTMGYEKGYIEGMAYQKQKDIEEFLEDLEIIEEIDWEKYFSKFFEIQEKWRGRVK